MGFGLLGGFGSFGSLVQVAEGHGGVDGAAGVENASRISKRPHSQMASTGQETKGCMMRRVPAMPVTKPSSISSLATASRALLTGTQSRFFSVSLSCSSNSRLAASTATAGISTT